MTINSVNKELQPNKHSQLKWGIGLLLAAIANIAVMGFSRGGGWTYWNDFFHGPELISNQQLIAAPRNYVGRYVKIVGSDNFETGIQSTETVNNHDYISRIVALKLDKTANTYHTLFVQVKDETPADNSVTGIISSTILVKIDDSTKSLMTKAATLPIVLDTTSDFYGQGQVGLGFSLLFGVAGAVTLLKKTKI